MRLGKLLNASAPPPMSGIKILAKVLTNDFSGLGLKKALFDHE